MPQDGSLKFVTGANDKYFFMCGMLLESLQSCFPGIACHVMDFGLSEPRRRFFAEKELLLDIPAGLSRTDHPYKLKSSMASFLNDEPANADLDRLRHHRRPERRAKSCLDLAGELVSHNKDIAIATDEGPNKTIRVTSAIPLARRNYDQPSRRSVARRAALPECGRRYFFKSRGAEKLAGRRGRARRRHVSGSECAQYHGLPGYRSRIGFGCPCLERPCADC